MLIHRVTGIRVKTNTIKGQDDVSAHDVEFYVTGASIRATFYTPAGQRLLVDGKDQWGIIPEQENLIAQRSIHLTQRAFHMVRILSGSGNHIQMLYAGDTCELSFSTYVPVEISVAPIVLTLIHGIWTDQWLRV
jgi:hypothetical protein